MDSKLSGRSRKALIVVWSAVMAFSLSRVMAQEITKVRGDQFIISNIKKTGIEPGIEFEIIDELGGPVGSGRLIKIKEGMGLGEILEGSVNKGNSIRKFPKGKSAKGIIKKKKLYLESFATGSYSSIKMDNGGEAPLLGQFGVGLSVGYWIQKWGWIGLTSDYRLISQYSTPSATSGNFRGAYWNYASLSFGKQFGRIKIKLDVHYVGKYSITNKTASGKETSYKSPLGLRVIGLYPLHFFQKKLHAGGLVEWIELRKQTVGTIDYDSSKKLWQAGVIIAYIF